MYVLVVLSTPAKQLRKFDKNIRAAIINTLEKIAENPFIGEMLKGDLSTIYSYHIKIAGTEYRIAYQIIELEIVVVVLQIGTRENFYKELKKSFKN